ncbi:MULTISPECIES: histidine phosphatase family protein [Methylococcus]|jgi:alpha-ribazole phosphatase/probable phosphoglycerate mutase|uniref:Alpha-ribazole phosphatase n=2 Tax=Methylococcus capsulatus TaxID=414 RepID=A0AA35UMA3_METCP|nr:alpha-ribazole phosphatase family protein [Methylococcus capsulatus]AAU92467.1 putative alpha-ribazole-5`-phosphate phosphatase CobC [Methylococcus capsulatus str. Bath]QXP88029.1 alpha-ribazole phosphatase family protein [Methylococcus capsulatus]QXP90617.1 alpha-ribazole phosphatase family protein [Methylococcus capsulatus]QXP94959.1 alpha-ribazole phosphatase family protein [Methylococcus capsulatus]UQN13057.1 alpha-ribazole phosphatase family protein [Methylococcus capsulatus]
MAGESCNTLVDLMRHGEPAGGSRYRGQIDDPLSAVGWEQMWRAVGRHCPWDVIVTSPLLRCQAFAEAFAERHRRPLEIEPRFKELGFGAWQGKTREEITTEYDPGVLQRFYRDPLNHRPENAEGLGDFRSRVISAWKEMLERHLGKHVLVVCHAGTIRMVIAHVLDVPLANLFHIKVANAGITRIECIEQGDEFLSQLVFHGGTPAA